MDEIAVLCVFIFAYIDNNNNNNNNKKNFGQNGSEDFPIQSAPNFFVCTQCSLASELATHSN